MASRRAADGAGTDGGDPKHPRESANCRLSLGFDAELLLGESSEQQLSVAITAAAATAATLLAETEELGDPGE